MRKRNGREFEAEIAKRTGAKKVPYSGAGVLPEDDMDDIWLIQAKETAHKSYSVKLEDLKALERNAAMMGKHPRMEISIQGQEYVILPTKIFDHINNSSD